MTEISGSPQATNVHIIAREAAEIYKAYTQAFREAEWRASVANGKYSRRSQTGIDSAKPRSILPELQLLRAIDNFGTSRTIAETALDEAIHYEHAYKAALWDGLQHFRQNNCSIVTAAVAEAAARGRDIDYPFQPAVAVPTVGPASAEVPSVVFSELLNGRLRAYGAAAMGGIQVARGYRDGPPL